jgi:hypothetical protein
VSFDAVLRAAGDRAPTRAAVEREIRKLAAELAASFLEALERMGLWEALANAPSRPAVSREIELVESDWGPPRIRRTTRALDELCERVLAVLRAHREPMAISAIAAALGLRPREVAHPLVWLQARGRVSKKGSRRGTRYAPKRAAPSRPTLNPRVRKPAGDVASTRGARGTHRPTASRQRRKSARRAR